MTDATLDLDTKPLVSSVEKADRALERLPKSLASLLRAMETAEKGFDALAKEGKSGLEALERAMDGANGHLTGAMRETVSGLVSSLREGNVQMLAKVKEGNLKLQGLYEQRLGTQGRLSDTELRLWKAHSVQLGGIQDAQLRKTTLNDILYIASEDERLDRLSQGKHKELLLLTQHYQSLAKVSSNFTSLDPSSKLLAKLSLEAPLQDLLQKNKAAVGVYRTEMYTALSSIGRDVPYTFGAESTSKSDVLASQEIIRNANLTGYRARQADLATHVAAMEVLQSELAKVYMNSPAGSAAALAQLKVQYQEEERVVNQAIAAEKANFLERVANYNLVEKALQATNARELARETGHANAVKVTADRVIADKVAANSVLLEISQARVIQNETTQKQIELDNTQHYTKLAAQAEALMALELSKISDYNLVEKALQATNARELARETEHANAVKATADRVIADKVAANSVLLGISKARLSQNEAGHKQELLDNAAFYAKQKLDAQAHAADLRANPASYISGPLAGMPMDITAVARHQAEMDNLTKKLPEAALATKKLTDSHISLKGALSEGNAAMRGFTQGIGTMSAGMYSMLPFMASFLAGAAVMKTLKVGAEFQTSMFVIGELAGNSQESMVKLKDSVLALADATQYGPLELAKGLETLTLAGLSATAAMQGLQPTLQFASATGMPVEKAAETLVAVQTAYKFTVEGFATIGDLIAKTAADTMSSGASMAEAFRTASVVAQQYKLTLEDTAVTLGMLANIGIQGGAAGTSYRNMITELNKGSGKAAEGIKALGAEVQNLDGSTRHIMDVMKDLSTGLITKTGAAQQRLLQDMTNERGAKAMAAFQSEMLGFLNKANPGLQEQANALFKIGDVLGGNKLLTDAVSEAYDKMRAKMEESVSTAAAFNFLADLEKRLTASAQFAGIGASLEKAFVEAFEKVGDSAFILGDRIRTALKSEEFDGVLVRLVSGVLALAKALFDIGDWLSNNSTALSGITVIFGAAAAIFLGPVGVVAGLTAGTVALQHLIDKFNIFESEVERAAVKEKARLETSIKAGELKLKDSQTQIDTQIEGQIKLLAKLRDKDKAEEDSIKAAGEAHLKRIEHMYEEKLQLIELIRLETVRAGMRESGANAIDVIASADSTAKLFTGQATLAKNNAMDKSERDMWQLIYLAKETAKISKENAAKANTNPYGVDKKGGYVGKTSSFVERLTLKQDNETETNLKTYNTELSSLINHEANKRKILEASRSNKLISEATYAGESLALTEKTEAVELSLIKSAQTQRAIDLGNDISKVRKQADAAIAKGAKEIEVAKTVDAAIAELGNKAATDMQTLQARADKVREAADTRTQISIDKQVAGLKELDRESAKFWTDEVIRQAQASSKIALEDSLRYASPEAAARISAMATEQDYWNTKLREQEVAVRAASKELREYQATLISNNNGTIEAVAVEEDYIAVLKKKTEQLEKLRVASRVAVTRAAEAAQVKFDKDNQQKLSEDVANALEIGLLQGGEAGKAKLRDILQAELMKPIRLMIQAFVNPIMGAVSGALGLNGMGGSSGGGLIGNLSSAAGIANFASNVGSGFAGAVGSGVSTLFGPAAGNAAIGMSLGQGTASSLAAANAAAGAAGTAGVSSTFSGISTALAAIPVWGWAAMAVAALGDFSGGHEETTATGIKGKFSNSGFAGNNFQDWKNEGSKGFFGIGASGRSSGRNLSALDSGMASSLGDSFKGMQEQAAIFAAQLGLSSDGVKSYTKDIELAFGSDKAANEAAVKAALTSAGNGMAEQALGTWSMQSVTRKVAESRQTQGSLGDNNRMENVETYTVMVDKVVSEYTYTASIFAKAGEGAMDTLNRLATSLTTVNAVFEGMGKALLPLSASSGNIASLLADAFGGLEKLAAGYASYYDKFYSTAEKTANTTNAVTKALASVGLSMPASRAAYRALVDGQDLNTEAGRAATVMLINMSGAFDTVATQTDALTSSMQNLTNSLVEEVRRIRGLMLGTSPEALVATEAKFAVTTAQARAGDQEALKALPALSQTLLAIAEANATTLSDLRVYQGTTAGSLQTTAELAATKYGLSVPSFDVGTNLVPQDMLAMVHRGEAIIPAAYNPANGAEGDEQLAILLGQILARLDSLDYGTQAIATYTNKSAKILDRITPNGTYIQTVVVTP